MPPAQLPDEERLEACFQAVDDALCDDDLGAAARRVAEARALAGADDPRVTYYEACLRWNEDGPAAAVSPLLRAVEAAPDFADAHHLLGLVYEQLGQAAAQRRHFLTVYELDERADARVGLGAPAELAVIERTASRVLDEIPARFRTLLGQVPVVLEPRPHRELVAEGFDPRALGLFEGHPSGDGPAVGMEISGADVLPRRIVLFTHNLLAEFHDARELEEQVEITILHEVGHFFGLDEDEVAELGLA